MRSALTLLAVLAVAASCGRGPDARPGTEAGLPTGAGVSAASEPAAAPAAQAAANRPPPALAVTVAPDPLGTAYTEDLPFSGALAAAGLPAGIFVPWDAQLWCSIRPLGAQ